MIVQWCIKGLALQNDTMARNIINRRTGILCNWWRAVGTIAQNVKPDKLTASNLDMHVITSPTKIRQLDHPSQKGRPSFHSPLAQSSGIHSEDKLRPYRPENRPLVRHQLRG